MCPWSGPGTDRGGSWLPPGLRALASRAGEGLALPPSCGCNWFSSLSLPPSLRLSSLFLSVLPPAHPCPRPPSFCCLWLLGAPPLLPCLLAWSCLLSRCLPQEVGTRHPQSPTLQERGLGAQTPGPGPTNRLRKCTAPRGVGQFPGPPHACPPTRLSVFPTHCFVPGPDSPRPALALPLTRPPPRGPDPVLSPGPLPPLPLQGAG